MDIKILLNYLILHIDSSYVVVFIMLSISFERDLKRYPSNFFNSFRPSFHTNFDTIAASLDMINIACVPVSSL
jgi:hypothetical protein